MNANEIKYNNYVLYENNIIQLDYDRLEILFCVRNFDDYQPIPLTEEWLQKFRFIENPDLDECEYYIITYEYDVDTCNLTTYLCFKFDNKGSLKQSMIQMADERSRDGKLLSSYFVENELQIRHVHTLQNFYFALTGNELQIK